MSIDSQSISRSFQFGGNMAGRPGRPPKDLSPFQDEILELVNEGYTYMYIKSHLEYQHGVRVGLRTLERQCSRWGVQKKRKPVNFEIESQLCLKKVVSRTKRSCGH